MRKYVMALGIVAIIGIAALLQDGLAAGIWNKGWKARMEHMGMNMDMEKRGMKWHRGMRFLLQMDREEGTLLYSNGTFYVGDMPLYLGDNWWLNHTIRSDYDGDGEYETVWEEINGLVGSHVVVNGRYHNETLIVSHINGIFLRMPFQADFVQVNGVLEKINGSFYIDGYHIVLRGKMARSDYDGDGLLERMAAEMNGLVGEEISIDGYIFRNAIHPLHINGIEI